MLHSPPANRPRPPALRIALVAAMCGAAFGLLQVGEHHAPPVVPTALDHPGSEVLTVDLQYRIALFAYDLARRAGVPGVSSPTAWEETAIADYERLAMGPEPDPAACHRLGLIYARRGYLRQAREMLTRAVTRDDGAGDVYWALLLVYSEDPIKAADVPRLRQNLLRQPSWLAMWSMADLAKRVDLPMLEGVYERRAQRAIDGFGLRVSLLCLCGVVIVGIGLVALLIVTLRALFARGVPYKAWPAALPPCSWLEILEVPALAVFCNALGQAGRNSTAALVTPGSLEDTGLRVAHIVLALGPPLVLVIARAGRGYVPWRRALGLTSQSVGRHCFEGLVGLGIALAAAIGVRDMILWALRMMVPTLGAVGARAPVPPEAASAAAELLLVVLLAPLVEEILFRGFVFRALLDRVRPIGAAGLSAILFAGAHLAWEPQAFLSLFCLGLVCAYMYQHSRSLLPSILLHAGYNAAILIAGFVLRT